MFYTSLIINSIIIYQVLTLIKIVFPNLLKDDEFYFIQWLYRYVL